MTGPMTPLILPVNSKKPKKPPTFFLGTSSNSKGLEAVHTEPSAAPPVMPATPNANNVGETINKMTVTIHNNPVHTKALVPP